ncbi:MAG: TIGR03663 family protein [Candidatus Hydrogenedentes bacterium]|nr:TIGR03663 family protein [Candidatus Hydrogenedentota bacterium]
MNKKIYIAVIVAFIAILCMAAMLRLPRLELRPVHGDEANQVMKTGVLFEKGEYKYDPHEHHGPTLYYFTLPVLWISGVSSFSESTITHYRIVTVLFGLFTLLLLWPMREALGSGAMLWAALLLAVSHVMTYYSRYYIQEMLLVCFTQAVFTTGWRLWHTPKIRWAILLGIALGLVHSTKETSAFIAFSLAGAIIATLVYTRLRDGYPIKKQFRTLKNNGILSYTAISCSAALLVSVVLFSSFFTHLRGPLDSLLTYTHYLTRAEGAGSIAVHDKPWYYYLSLLTYTYRQVGPRWSEALTLVLAGIGAIAALWPTASKHRSEDTTLKQALTFKRFLTFYSLLIVLIYSLIPYKTPWNLIVFYHAAALLAGIGASTLVQMGRWRIIQSIICLILLTGTAHMAHQNYQGNFIYPADARNPYVYAHPSTALHRLTTRIKDISAVSPSSTALHINVIRPDGDYWPLPWYLRQYSRVGWWHHIPKSPDAAIILAAPELYEILQERLGDEYLVEFHALRPGILLHTYIRRDLWDAFMQTRQ